MKPATGRIAVDLCAGAGGVEVALHTLGWRSFSVEVDPAAVQTLNAAIREGYCGGTVYQGDAALTDRWTEVMAMTHGFKGSVDLLWSSHPCPRWSRANTPERREQAVDGWPWALDAVNRHRPRAVVLENVKDAPVQEWADALRELYPFVDVWTLDAAHFGAPQTRPRRFVVARRDAPLLWPRPTHGPDCEQRLQTLGDVMLDEATARAQGLVIYPKGQGLAASQPWRLDEPAPCVMCTEHKGTRAAETTGWAFRLGPDRASDAAFLATGRRRLTVRECAALQTFPAGYPWCGTVEDAYRQIGNAVPSVLAMAVLRAML